MNFWHYYFHKWLPNTLALWPLFCFFKYVTVRYSNDRLLYFFYLRRNVYRHFIARIYDFLTIYCCFRKYSRCNLSTFWITPSLRFRIGSNINRLCHIVKFANYLLMMCRLIAFWTPVFWLNIMMSRIVHHKFIVC